jgi:hypothetical protein
MNTEPPERPVDEAAAFLVDLLMQTKVTRDRAEASGLPMIAFLISMAEDEAREIISRADR